MNNLLFSYANTFDCYIHNYSSVCDTQYQLYTQQYSAANYHWKLHVYPKGRNHKEQDNKLSLYLVPTDLGDATANVECQVSLVSNKDWSLNITRTFIKTFQQSVTTWGWSSFATQQQVSNPASGFLEGDSVHFRVQILPRHQDQGQEVSLLYKYQRLTDGIIRSGKEEFPVHATRLAESSHVVANMLLDLSDEFSISHKVDLSVLFRGFSSEVIFQLLCHVYNPLHQIGTLRHVQELAELAQKLFMPGLQGKIIKFITENYQLMKAGTGKIEQDETHVLQILQLSERFRWCDVMIVCEWVIFQQGRVLAGNNNINSKVQERILRIQGNAKAAGKQLKEINLAQYIANCKKIYENYAL